VYFELSGTLVLLKFLQSQAMADSELGTGNFSIFLLYLFFLLPDVERRRHISPARVPVARRTLSPDRVPYSSDSSISDRYRY
jgi:hypothetical protein